jgi:hypothetical protein
MNRGGRPPIRLLNDVQGGRLQTSDTRAVAFCYLAGLRLRYNAAIGPHADRLAWLSGLSLKGSEAFYTQFLSASWRHAFPSSDESLSVSCR